jgi:hypothetical protein
MIIDVVIVQPASLGRVGGSDGEIIARVIEAVPDWVRDVYVIAPAGPRGPGGLAAAVTSAGAKLLSSQEPGVGSQLERARVHLCALPRPPDVVTFLSPDGSDDPKEISLLLAPIRAGGVDLVMGSRARGLRERGSPGCGLSQRIGALLIGLIYRQRYSDLSPFRAIRLPAWVALALHDKSWGYFIEMQIKAARAGLRVVEVPVHARRAARPRFFARLNALAGTSWRFSYLLLRHATAR